MVKIEVLRQNGTICTVAASILCPCLAYHQALEDKTKITVTHVPSGLAVLVAVPYDLLDLISEFLLRQDWARPPEDIFTSSAHKKEVEALMTEHHRRSRAQEARLADDLDGKTIPGSGGTWGYSGDVRTPDLLIEAKTTSAKTHRVTFADLEYLGKKADLKGKLPAFVVEFQKREELVLLRYDDLLPAAIEHLKKPVLYRRGHKGITLGGKATSGVTDDSCLLIIGPVRYLLMNYLSFLRVTKPENS